MNDEQNHDTSAEVTEDEPQKGDQSGSATEAEGDELTPDDSANSRPEYNSGEPDPNGDWEEEERDFVEQLAQKDEHLQQQRPTVDYDTVFAGLDKKRVVEAVLFVEAEPVSTREVAQRTGLEMEQVQALIHELQEDYNQVAAGFELIEIAEGYQMMARRCYTDRLFHMRAQKKSRPKFNRPALETLAIIAYRQNITRAEIDDIRGVNSAGAIKTLLGADVIKINGRKKALGNPLQYGTTREFLKYFGLKSLKDLPKLKELKELEF